MFGPILGCLGLFWDVWAYFGMFGPIFSRPLLLVLGKGTGKWM